MARNSPSMVVIAGPEGAGKSTLAPILFQETLGLKEFVNVDGVAQGTVATATRPLARRTGGSILRRLQELGGRRVSFGFETTLASRAWAGPMESLEESGYQIHLVFLWLPTPAFAVERVQDRVRMGGCRVPEATVMRQYQSGLWNFFIDYQALATTWRVYDNSRWLRPRLISSGRSLGVEKIHDYHLWWQLRRSIGYDR